MSATVIWSGGMDSTLLLAQSLKERSGVRALTLIHPQLPQDLLEKERKARSEFKRWVKKRGWDLEHYEVRIKTRAAVISDPGQPGLWLSHLLPYALPRDEVRFGYIRGDDIWHEIHTFRQVFDVTMRMHRSRATLAFPYEWHSKVDIVHGLRAFRIPKRCYWTCACPRGTTLRACGKCRKCREARRARDDAREGIRTPGLEISPKNTAKTTVIRRTDDEADC